MDLDKYNISMKHLIKYLKTTDDVTFRDDKLILTLPVHRLKWLQQVVAEAKQVLFGSKFRVFKDKSIEIPFSFKDEDLDEFLVEVGKRGIFGFSSVPEG